MKVAAAIPAKGTSSRVPSKNLQKVLGVPLFLWAANNLNRVLPKEDIFVDSDSEEILSLAKRFGYSTIRRPSDLATNATDGNQLMLWQTSNIDADVILQHLPPMIFLKEDTIRKCIEAVLRDYDSAFALHREAFYLWDDDGPRYDLQNIPNSFTLPKLGIEGMGLYVARKRKLEEEKTRICGRFLPVETDPFERIDIDYPADLELATSIARGLDRNSEYCKGIEQYFVRPEIKLLVLDVDGVMTDGGMYYTESGDQFKKFHTKDGIAIKRMIDAGIEVRFLSSGTNSSLIKERGKTLGVNVSYCGLEEKKSILETWMQELRLNKGEVGYIGDDINDLSAMELAGWVACPSDSSDAVRKCADVVLDSKGGEGCIREAWGKYLDLEI